MRGIFIFILVSSVAYSYKHTPTFFRTNIIDSSISLPDQALGELFFSTKENRENLITTTKVTHLVSANADPSPPPLLLHDTLSPVFAILLNTFLLYIHKIGKNSR